MYRSARELRRVSAILESPVVTNLSEALGATSTICAYDASSYFLSIYDLSLDRATAAAIMRESLNTWVTSRAEFLSALIVLTCGTLYVSGRLPAVQAGLALSTAISFAKNVYLLLWAMIQVEVEMNSVERLQHYMHRIPQEIEEKEVVFDSSWPKSGEIEFKDAVFKYRSQKELALDHIDLKIKTGERIGLVGRTGTFSSPNP
jgi:ABC-type multidrug transport system fused ATPase/permease subunit